MNIQKILSNKKQAPVFCFLTLAPKRAFSAKEIATALKTNTKSVENALSELQALKAIHLVSRGNAKLYIMKTKNAELEEYLKKKFDHKDALAQSVKTLGKLQAAYLTGVFVDLPQMRVDLLLVGNVKPEKLQKFLDTIQKISGTEINYCVMDPQEFELRHAAFDMFIKDVLDSPHINLIG